MRPGRDAVILANGNLGYNGSHPTSAALYPAWDLWHGGDFCEVTPDGEIVWRHEDIFHHHGANWLPNGHLLYTVAAPLPADKAAKVNGIIQSDIVREVDRKGDVVWEYVIPDFAEYPSPLSDFIVGATNSCFRAHRYRAEQVPWL